MGAERCIWGVCFVALDGSGQKFFGFSEFLAGLALMVLVWTIADVRYRFRVQTAPIPLQGITFVVIAALGILTLLTDLWRAEQWLVPEGNLLTPAMWQAILGGLFLLTFLIWTWFAFIRPPIYGRHNAERFANALFRHILKGASADLAVIADELSRSARALVQYATDRGKRRRGRRTHEDMTKTPPKVERCANELLMLIAHKKLCRAIVESSPATALAVFQAMADTKKYSIPVETFAKNIVDEALANKDSFLYHEDENNCSGLIGNLQLLSKAMFANHEMVEAVGTLLAPDIDSMEKWDVAQWEAYCRVALIAFSSYVKNGHEGESLVVNSAMVYINDSVSDLYTLNLNELTTDGYSGVRRRLGVVINYVKKAVNILDKKGVPSHVRMRIRKRFGHPGESFYDGIANMIFELISCASAVKLPLWECWVVQHHLVWGPLFDLHLNNAAGRVVKFKLRRLLYDEIVDMEHYPNFRGARILSFCLNVMGFTVSQEDSYKDSRPLQRAVLAWTKKNYVWLHEHNQNLAEACLVDGISYDLENRRLVRKLPTDWLRRGPEYIYFELDPAP